MLNFKKEIKAEFSENLFIAWNFDGFDPPSEQHKNNSQVASTYT